MSLEPETVNPSADFLELSDSQRSFQNKQRLPVHIINMPNPPPPAPPVPPAPPTDANPSTPKSATPRRRPKKTTSPLRSQTSKANLYSPEGSTRKKVIPPLPRVSD